MRKNEITFFGKTWRYEEEYFQTPMTSYLEFSMKIYLIESNQLIYETRGFLNRNKMHKGFTLLEVLISLIILSIIAVVSTNFLQSSVILKNQA